MYTKGGHSDALMLIMGRNFEEIRTRLSLFLAAVESKTL